MTATTRVSDIKGTRVKGNRDGKPKPGTKLREVYDALRTGAVVNVNQFSPAKNTSVYLAQLRDFYGMDIESVRNVGSRLLGEWEGPYYVPIERIVAGMAGEA